MSNEYPEGTVLFNIEYKETFQFKKSRDGLIVRTYPTRFRTATEEDIAAYPILT